MPSLFCYLVLLFFTITTAMLSFAALRDGINIVDPYDTSGVVQSLK